MTAYVSSDPLRHPWFASASLKRKKISDPDSDNEDELDQTSRILYPTPPPTSMNASWGDNAIAGASGSAGRRHGGHGQYLVEEVSSDSGSDAQVKGVGLERKRRRYEAVERRMARMSLEGANANSGGELELEMDSEPLNASTDIAQNVSGGQNVQAPPIQTSSSAGSYASSNGDYTWTAGSVSPVWKSAILSQYAVEEPTSPEELRAQTSLPSVGREGGLSVEEVPVGRIRPSPASEVMEARMSGTQPAWYEREKDRIVITDLDEAAKSEDEDEYKSEAEPHPDASDYGDSNGDYSISSILLDHLKRNNKPIPINPDAFSLTAKPQGKEGALILYKPPPTFGSLQLPRSADKEEETLMVDSTPMEIPPSVAGGEDDAMDIDS